MAEKYSFFNAILKGEKYDRTYKAEDLAEYFASFIANGVFPNPSTNLQVMSTGNMDISIGTGKAWINGYYYNNTETLTKTLNVADGTLDRIDLVVLRLDLTKRLMQIDIKVGTTASKPVVPELARTDDIYELGLASIYIASGVTSITQANIRDLRYNQEYCGYVTNTVTTVDTTTLLAQAEAWMKGKETEYEAEFLNWFNNLQTVLSGDVAGNLTNLIETNAQSINLINNSIADLDTIRNNVNNVIKNNKKKTYIIASGINVNISNYDNKHNWYYIKNGFCTLNLDISVKYWTGNNSSISESSILNNIPKPIGEIHGILGNFDDKNKVPQDFIIKEDGSVVLMKIHSINAKIRYSGTITYPIAE